MDLDSIIRQLREERDRLDAAIAALTSVGGNTARAAGRRSRRTMSIAARRRIAAAQRARWAKVRAAKKK